ncbi:hypothetical protein BU24DRAFT_247085 [Aaosphaeria arxii CBS 175.79]|uniref:Uncharacterized protein n=1 Tax=Aaosphaeria arxii CBS 175.79 TaxID=1450172 RepID=A0A6A5XLQ4_9PLEO|nr:uncharacterized protein BU24DRAFT_247085 [Aaosphaeria arxii CBS 175.79]KAF2013789.1 hypothetical protein BU24DRAFT_247085 [Aaosphaeria arxii CBS 175.79]
MCGHITEMDVRDILSLRDQAVVRPPFLVSSSSNNYYVRSMYTHDCYGTRSWRSRTAEYSLCSPSLVFCTALSLLISLCVLSNHAHTRYLGISFLVTNQNDPSVLQLHRSRESSSPHSERFHLPSLQAVSPALKLGLGDSRESINFITKAKWVYAGLPIASSFALLPEPHGDRSVSQTLPVLPTIHYDSSLHRVLYCIIAPGRLKNSVEAVYYEGVPPTQ